MADIRIRFDDSEAQTYLRTHGPRKVHNALRSAIRTTTTWAEKRLDQRLAAETAIPINVFRRFRVKKKILGGSSAAAFGGGGQMEQGRIWSGYNPVKARFAGKMEQSSGGAFAGQYYFGGGFIATMRRSSNLTGIFKRTAKRSPDDVKNRGLLRWKIEEQVVELRQAEAIAAQVADDAGQEFMRRFRAKFADS
jgi:hypothetical protein